LSLNTMARRMSLEIPGIADAYAKTLLNEALAQIADSRMWSFGLSDGGWFTPGILFSSGVGGLSSAGTVTFTPYSNQVIGDVTASAAWAAYATLPPLTQFQIRSPYSTPYSIVGYDVTSHAPFGTFTLDRVWMEPGGVAQPYMVYQCYFPAPVADFKRFFDILDTTNNSPIDYWSLSQNDLAYMDAQRLIFDQPTYAVPFGRDQRPNTATPNYFLFELWPHPLSQLPYTLKYLRRGPQLVNPGDLVPEPLTEELVLWRAKENAYLWREAQKGEHVERGSGADYKFLAQAAAASYKACLKPAMDRDRDSVNLYFNRFRRDLYGSGDPFSNNSNQLNIGR